IGDRIEKDELLLEIETDKAVTDVEAAVSGTLAEIVRGEGEEVDVGTVIAWIETT
ncbi:MAG TPA: biotin attachment protein, partial [Spirochaetaceae bacterium]|nr:biotin attachment protein [Spirochaetaceae bacterium]